MLSLLSVIVTYRYLFGVLAMASDCCGANGGGKEEDVCWLPRGFLLGGAALMPMYLAVCVLHTPKALAEDNTPVRLKCSCEFCAHDTNPFV